MEITTKHIIEDKNNIPLLYKMICVALVFSSIITFVFITKLFSVAIQVVRMSQSIGGGEYSTNNNIGIDEIIKNGVVNINSERELDSAINNLSVMEDRKSLEQALKENNKIKIDLANKIDLYKKAEKTPFITYQNKVLIAKLELFDFRTKFYQFGIKNFKNYSINEGRFECHTNAVCDEFATIINEMNESKQKILTMTANTKEILDTPVLSLLGNKFYEDLMR